MTLGSAARAVVEKVEARAGTLPFPQRNTIILDRLKDAAAVMGTPGTDTTFQHSILCQAGLPYRDPGRGVREWQRDQGSASLLIEAGQAHNAETGEWVKLGLPWGPKARLILMHLNSMAIRTQSPVVCVGDSLTDFVKRIGLTTDGRTIRGIKDQVGALSAAMIRLAFHGQDTAYQINTPVVRGFDLWFPKDTQQRVLWPSTVELSPDYYQSLQKHAVPLDERAIGALSHSAMALDTYAWLAQRLHRIPKGQRHCIVWPLLQDQFGWGYKDLKKFREVFMRTLRQVNAVYPAMKIDATGQGLFLYNSPPPVMKTGVVARLPGARA